MLTNLRIQYQGEFVMTSRTTDCSRKTMYCTTNYHYYYYYYYYYYFLILLLRLLISFWVAEEVRLRRSDTN